MTKQNKTLKNADSAEDFYQQAMGHLKKQEFNQAKVCLEQSLAIKKTARAYHDLGVIHHKDNRTVEAVAAFQAAIELDPAWHQSYANLYRIMGRMGNIPDSLRYCAQAIMVAPDVALYKENFLQIAQDVEFIEFDPVIKSAIVQCLSGYDCNHPQLIRMWLIFLEQDPDMDPVRKLLEAKDYKNFCQIFSKLTATKGFFDQFLLIGFRRFLVPSPLFERLVQNLRCLFLEEKDSIFIEPPLALMEALAEYCFMSEYIMSETAAETKKLKALEEEPRSVRSLCIIGCYKPLRMLGDAAEIEKNFSGDEIIGVLIHIQITGPNRERELRETIPVLGSMNDAFSAKVRGQYEEFPYPRWKSLSKYYREEYLAHIERGPEHSVLVAGCGTGESTLSYAALNPKTNILAVDLSLTSLSYAKREAEERGLTNISFMQADILELEKLDRTFDLIHCTGVLHHMNDPMAGWKVLRKILKPKGLMRLGLYSELARRDLIPIRKLIKDKGYKNDAADIKRFRDEYGALDPETYKKLAFSVDFYSVSACRDLYFHVHEMRFTIPLLKKYLEELGLEFVVFCTPSKINRLYASMFPTDKNLNNLDYWAKFEEEHPYTFATMYQFWVRALE